MKRLIFLLLCAVCLASCSNNSENEEISSSEEVSISETVTTAAAVQTTQAATDEAATTAVDVPFYFGDENEVPENAVYKQIRKSYSNGELTSRDIYFYDYHDNVILILFQTNPESDKPSKIEYVYNYNADGTVSSMDMNVLVGNGNNEHTDYEYNPDGTVSREEKFNNDELWGSMEYFYDGHSEPIRKVAYFTSDGGFSSSTDYEYEYDFNGRATEMRTNSQTSDYNSVEKYVYDENGNVKECTQTSDIGEKKKVYTYDANNREIKVESYFNGSLEYYYEYEYEELKK